MPKARSMTASTEILRTASRTREMSQAARRSAPARVRSSTGMITSLHIMVLSETDAMITMPVAADRPPTKASSAIGGAPAAMGSAMT